MDKPRLSDETRFILHRSKVQALERHHGYVGPEHLLLAIASQKDSLSAQVLTNLATPPYKIKSAIDFIVERGVKGSDLLEPQLTPSSRKVIQLSLEEAKQNHSSVVEPWYLLIGMVQEQESVAYWVLHSFGKELMTVEHIRHQVAQLAGPTIN